MVDINYLRTIRCCDLMKKPNLIHISEKSSRILEIPLNGKTLSTPTYFPAISSYGIKFSLNDLLYLLKFHKYPRVLISAYDLHHIKKTEKKKVLSLIEGYRKTGVIFLDSGLFESSWKDDERWNINAYRSILSQAKFDLYSSFDVYRAYEESYEQFKKNTYDHILESSPFLNKTVFFAIFHESSPTQLVRLVEEFVEKHSSLCRNIAVAERDIGKSIQERSETVVAIRKTLDDNDNRSLLHILGCGNPLSMLLYSFCGADCFDSLDWLKYAINPDNYSVDDFSHLELLKCKCRVCTELPYMSADYSEKVLLHNLLFYQNFVMQMQSLIRNDNLKAYLHKWVGRNVVDQLEKY